MCGCIWGDVMLLPDIGDFLSTGGLGLTTGTNLFLGRMPALPITASAVYETGGQATVHAFGATAGSAAVMERPRFQVVVRSSGGYAAARSTMQGIFTRLDGARDQTINGIRYDWIASVQSPFFLKTDENDHSLIAVNFDVSKRVG